MTHLCQPNKTQSHRSSENKSLWDNMVLALGIKRNKNRNKTNNSLSLSSTLEELAEKNEEEKAPVSPHQRSLFENIIVLGETTAENVMIPRADISAVSQNIAINELVKVMIDKAHSRLPVYNENLDDITGIIHIKDVLHYVATGKKCNLQSLIREVLFVSPAIRVLDLLSEMRLSRIHMALVVDEFGGIDGLITIEDLVEEIVGEIDDEHDIDQNPKLITLSEGCYIADARYEITLFSEKINLKLSNRHIDEDIETLGGLVFSLAGRVPGRGELIEHPNGIQFEILEADSRRIRRLRIYITPPKKIIPLTTQEKIKIKNHY